MDNRVIKFEYKNWKGVTSIRTVTPINIWFGHTEWHKDDQWLLLALDEDKQAERNFAIKDILNFL